MLLWCIISTNPTAVIFWNGMTYHIFLCPWDIIHLWVSKIRERIYHLFYLMVGILEYSLQISLVYNNHQQCPNSRHNVFNTVFVSSFFWRNLNISDHYIHSCHSLCICIIKLIHVYLYVLSQSIFTFFNSLFVTHTFLSPAISTGRHHVLKSW